MRFNFLSSLLLTAWAVFAHSSGCAEELSKYNTCISVIDSNSNSNLLHSSSEFDIQTMCSKFHSSDCETFISDINTTTTHCDLTSDHERSEALTILNLRIAYLKYCALDDQGRTCPVSRHLAEENNSENNVENTHTHDHNDINEPHTHDEHTHDEHTHDEHTHDEHTHDEHTHDEHTHDEHTHDEHTHDEHTHDEHTHDEHTHDEHTHDEHTHDEHTHDEHTHDHEVQDHTDDGHDHDHDHAHEQNNTNNNSGHNHNHGTAFTEDDIKPRKLSEFNGDYQSVYPYFLTGDLADYVVQQAEKNNNTYAKQWDIINEKWNCGVSYFSVRDNTISLIYEDGRKEKAEYTPNGFATKKNDKGEISSVRYKFETKSKNAPKYVMLNDHGHEPSTEEITHVHFHFSNVSYDDIMTSKLISFFVQERYDSDETREVLLGHDGFDETLYPGEEVSTFNDEDVRDRTLSNWNGEWISPYQYLLDGKLDKAFEVKAESKGDKTAEEYKEYYKKGYETDIDSISIKNNEIKYTYINGKKITAKYEYKGYYIQHWSSGTKAAMYRFENIDKKSEAPRLIEINDHMITRSQPVHFHLRMTNISWDDVDAENRWPTFFPKSSSIDEIIDEISGVAHSHNNEEKEHDHDHDHDHAHEQNNTNNNAHSHNHGTAFTEDDIKPRKLSEFNGDYQSVYPYFLTGDLADYVVQQAEKNNNTYAKQWDIINEKWNCGVSYFSVRDNTISLIYEDGRKEKAEYTPNGFATKKNDKGEISSVRYKFETKSKNAPKYVMLNDHGHEPSTEEITHVHFHFSNVSYDDIMTSKLISFFVQERYDSDETREVLLGHDSFDETLYPGEEVSTFNDEDVRDRTLSNWNGEWISPYQYLLDGKLDKAFEVKAESKGDKTAEEYKEYYKKGYETDIDSISIKNNEIKYTYINGKKITAKYEYKGYYIQHWSSGTKAAMYRFENIDKKSEAPRLIEINDHMITRSQPVHFHLRMTNISWDDVDAENHWPTFFPKSSSIDEIIDEISGVAHSHNNEEKEHDHDHDEDTGVKNRELFDFEGEWKSLYPYILSGQLDDACILNPGDRTYEECRYHYINNFKTDIVNMIIKDNKITFIFDNGLSATSEYINRGPVVVEWTPGTFSGFYQYEAKDKDSGVPKFILFNDHNNGPAKAEHLHFRSGDVLFETVDRENKVWGMFYPQSTPDEEIIASFNGTSSTHSHQSEEGNDKEKTDDHDHDHDHDENEITDDKEIIQFFVEEDNLSDQEEINDSNQEDSENDDEANAIINTYDYGHEEEQEHDEHSFYHDLMEDCQIEECNQRFITLVELLKATGNPEADEFEAFIKYYKKSNCDAIHKLVEANSGSLPLVKISISFIITILLSIIYLI